MKMPQSPPNPSANPTVPPLRAVSPQERRRAVVASTNADLPPAAQPATAATANANAKAPARSPWRPWLLWVVAIATLAAVGSIKIPNYVTGEATVAARVNARDRLTMPRSGIIRIRVERNDEVEPGDAIAEIESPELAQQMAQAERGLEQAEGALQAAQQNLMIAQARWEASQQETAIARNRARDRQTDWRAVATRGLPRSRQIQQEQAALGQEIQALHSQIASGQSEIQAAANEVAQLEQQRAHKQQIYDERYALTQMENPPISENHPMVEGLKAEILDLNRRIQAAQDRQQTQQHGIAETRQLIGQRQRQIAARGEQVQEVARQTQDEFQTERDAWQLTAARSQATAREVTAAEADLRAQSELVTQWQQELERLQAEQEQLILRAETSGTVLAEDLDLKDGSRLEAGEEVLSIANLQELRATVQIRQEDSSLVALEQPVKFQAQGDEPYRAAVSDRALTIETETPGAAPMASVEILIENETGDLLPGGEGYAHIRTGKLRIYQKVQHELGKLFNFGKWVPW